jgi:glycosyltransferase involved in cell wall biosynthesis
MSAKIGLFHPSFAKLGGAEILLASQATSLRRRGFDVCVVSRSREPKGRSSGLDGVSVRLLRRNRLRDALSGAVERLEREALRAAEALRDRDVVMAMNFPSSAELGAAEMTAKKVWYCNEPYRDYHWIDANPRLSTQVISGRSAGTQAEAYFRRKLAGYRRSMRWPSTLRRLREFDITETRRLDEVIAISEFTRDNLRRTHGIEASRVVYPIVRFPRPGRSRTGLDRQHFGILVQTRLEFVKNVEVLIRAFARFRARCPSAHLHIVGEGHLKGRLAALARTLDVPVEFHGFVSAAKVDAISDACDVFALMPFDEPFGMVFPEAAARGLLLVGPDHGGPLEILDGGRLGFVADPLSPESVAEAFSRIHALSDAEADRHRSEASAACLSRFSEETIGSQLAHALAG